MHLPCLSYLFLITHPLFNSVQWFSCWFLLFDLAKCSPDCASLGSLCQHDFIATYSSTSQGTLSQRDSSAYILSTVLLSDHDVYGRRRAKVWPHPNVEVAVHKTIEVDVDLLQMDEEHGGKHTISVRSQEDIQLMEAELQMKKDFQI